MKRRVAFIEFPIYDQFPLVSGYLHAYAQADPVVAEAFEFVYWQKEVEEASYPETLSAIRGLDASVLCFSSYVWNMGLIKRLVNDLRSDPKIYRIILGGHQVTHHIGDYFDGSDDKIVVINGQGEIPFRATLQRLTDTGNLAGLQGVSYYTGGQLVGGGEAEMISNLDDIPSPFLSGPFEKMAHPITMFETNRGCPFKCTFCTWGGDTLTVTRFALDRVKEELLWIAKKSVMFIYIADANWGMLSRDVEISEYIAKLKKDYGSPWMVYYAAAKNQPKGSVDCIAKFHEGGVITSQALGIQSMDPHTLELIDRKNIKNTAFVQMFEELKARKIDSYCELIWPLPGETLESLKRGFAELVSLGAQTVIMYPAMLINNARLTAQADEFEMETLACADWRSELKLVKKTKFADRTAVDDGLWFYYAFFLLSNCDPKKALVKCLSHLTGKDFVQIVSEFAAYLRQHANTSAYGQLLSGVFREEAHGSLLTIGRLAAHLTYQQRFAAQADVARFVATTQLAGDRRGLALSLLWSLALPKLFANTQDDHVRLVSLLDDLGRAEHHSVSGLARVHKEGAATVLELESVPEVWQELLPFFDGKAPAEDVQRIEIRHPPVQMHYHAKDEHRNLVYAHGMIQRLSFIAAQTRAVAASGALAS